MGISGERGQQSKPEFEPRSKQEKINNKSIAQRIRNIVHAREPQDPVAAELINEFSRTRISCIDFLRSEGFNSSHITLTIIYSKGKRNSRTIENIPNGLNFPVYIVESHNTYRTEDVTSSYGPMPEEVRGVDNKIYGFENIFYFSSDGKGIKYERVSAGEDQEDIDEDDESSGLAVKMREYYNNLTTLTFNPSEDRSKFVHLQGEDYIKVEEKLKLIEAGEFTRDTL